MKVKGIKRGNSIELIDPSLDIPDGTEITFVIDDQTPPSPKEFQDQLQALATHPPSDDFFEAMASVDHERQLSRELARLNLDLQATADETPLTDLIGSAPGSFATPAEADQFIRQERDAWDY